MTYIAALRRFNLNVRLFLISTAIIGLTNFGGIFSTLFNLYLLRLGYTTQFIGTLNAVSSFAMFAACLPASMLTRRFGSRKTMLVGLFLNAFSSMLLQGAVFIPAAIRTAYLLISYTLNSFGLTLYLISSQPFLAEATTSVERGHAYSVQSSLWPLSGFIGSLLGGAIPGFFANLTGIPLTGPGPYQLTLWISSVLSAFAFLIMLPSQQPVPEPTPPAPARARPGTLALGVSHSRANDPTPIQTIAFLSAIVLFQITGEATIRMFLNVYLDDALATPTSLIGLILGIGQFIAGLGALLTPLFVKRLGKSLTFVVFSLAISLCMLPLIFIPTWYGAGMGYMGAIIMVQIARPALITIQMESVPNAYRALMSAATTMTASLGMGAISMLGGRMIPSFGYPAFFLVGAWLTALAAIGFWLYNKLIRGGNPL